MDITAIISVICVFIGAPAIVFGFLLMGKRYKKEIEMMKYKKEMMELEIEKEHMHIKLLEAENAKYDRIIEDRKK
jgi:hypothetical protein